VAGAVNQVRIYRVSRILTLVELDENFVREPSFDLAGFWRRVREDFEKTIFQDEAVLALVGRRAWRSWAQSQRARHPGGLSRVPKNRMSTVGAGSGFPSFLSDDARDLNLCMLGAEAIVEDRWRLLRPLSTRPVRSRISIGDAGERSMTG